MYSHNCVSKDVDGMQCSVGLEWEMLPLDDIGVVWKGFAARCKTVGSAERRKSAQRISTRRASSNLQSLRIEAQRPLGRISINVRITERS